MHSSMKPLVGKVITACGPVAPEALGKVQMHEHLHADMFDWEKDCLIREERPISAERRAFLLREAVPHMKACVEQYGPCAWVETSMNPWRAWPTFYREVTELTGMHCILISGFYRQVEGGKYWAKHRAEDGISPMLLDHSIEDLVAFCVREVAEGIHGTGIRAGGLKFGTSATQLTEVEIKAARVVARAQKQTGVHITTHCPPGGDIAQLRLMDEEGVDLSRLVIGHTARHLMNPETRKTCMEWMRRGANYLPTNFGIANLADIERWRPLVEGIHEVFERGLGAHVCFSLDGAFCSESGPFAFSIVAPPPLFLNMYTHTLPAFRKLGLTAEEEDWIMRRNPQRILPVA